MNSLQRLLVAGIAAVSLVLTAPQSPAQSAGTVNELAFISETDDPNEGCATETDMMAISGECRWSTTEVRGAFATSNLSNVKIRLVPKCGFGGAAMCRDLETCVNDEGNDGFWVNVLRSTDGSPWVDVGDYCLAEKDAEDFQVLTVKWIKRHFANLVWPAAAISVQPIGKTLVNFNTNFFTDLSEPVDQTVTGPGSTAVTIRATPVRFSWHWGDGAQDTTESPGAEYIAAGRKVTVGHVYSATGTYSPSVDVTFSGCYFLVEEGGECIDLNQTVTVPGDAVDLEVITAEPRLVQ